MSYSCLHHIENYWKLKTSNANQLFNEGKYEQALTGYKEALYRAEVLNNNFLKCNKVGIPFMQVYVISCNNLVNTHLELGEINQATKLLKRSVYYLLYLAKKNASHLKEIQSELKRAVITYFNLTKDTKESNNEEQLMLALKEGLLAKRNYRNQLNS